MPKPSNAATSVRPPGAGARPSAEPFFVPPILIAPFGLTDVGTESTPTFVDIDDDGDLDAFIGEFFGDTYYFENTGTITNPAFADPITDPFGLTDVILRSAPAFADIDNDGDLDAFIGEDGGDTNFFENTGTATNPAFAPPVTNPFGLTDVSIESAPTFVDIDDDGDLDAFIGDSFGTTNFFENTGTITNPAFADPITDPFGLTDVGANNKPAFTDLDDDGDLDVLIGVLGGNTNYFENTGTATNPAFADPITDPFGLTVVGLESAPTFADLDDDGDLDAFIGEVTGATNYFENTGTATNPAFLPSTANPFGLADVGKHSKPAFADLDGDGDLDAFSGELSGKTFYFENTGSATIPAFADPIANPFGLTDVGSESTPVFADLDGDGDLDAFIGEFFGRTYYFENTRTATNPAFADPITNPFGLTNVGSASAPAFADLDGDGDLDAFIGEKFGSTYYLENTGTITNPAFADPIIDPFGLSDVGDRSKPTFADLDGDGDLDAFIGEKDGETFYFENTGTATNPAFADPITNPFGLADVGVFSAPAFADIDDDGDFDAFIGEDDGETFYFENVTVTSEGLTLELTPLGSLDIPPEGGFIELDLTLTNETEETQEVDFWVTIVNTDAGIDRTRNPLPITLAPGQTKTHTLSQQVPGAAPSGDYTYSAFVGAFPDDVAASDSFVFTKEAGALKVATASGQDWSLRLEEAAKTSTEQPSQGSFTLAQNFPNPFMRATEIRFSVASAGPVTVAVYDLTGRRVTTLFEGEAEAGRPYALRFEAEGLAAGIYLYELRQGGRRQTLTMMLVK